MFNPKRVLILSKITRYEFEGSVIGVSDEQQIRSALKRKGLNVDALLARHQVHHEKLSEFRKQLSARGVDVQVVDRLGYTADAVNWADVIFTAGGDGTFLLGAHKIRTRDKLIIGLNTDPDLDIFCSAPDGTNRKVSVPYSRLNRQSLQPRRICAFFALP